MLAAKCKFLSSFQGENIPSPDLLLRPQHIIPVEGSLAKKSCDNSQPCLQSGSGTGASSPPRIPWPYCPAEMSLIPPSVPSRLWLAWLSDGQYIQQAARLLLLNVRFSCGFRRNDVAKSPSPLLGASGAFHAKPPLSCTLHADRQEVHTKIHLSSLPLTEPKQKTDGKIKCWQCEACGLHLHQPSWSCRAYSLLLRSLRATPAFHKRVIAQGRGFLLLPPANHRTAWRWKGKQKARADLAF